MPHFSSSSPILDSCIFLASRFFIINLPHFTSISIRGPSHFWRRGPFLLLFVSISLLITFFHPLFGFGTHYRQRSIFHDIDTQKGSPETMNCFSCFQRKKESSHDHDNVPVADVRSHTSPPPPVSAHKPNPSADSSSRAGASRAENGNANGSGKIFTFRELAMATKTFRQECLLGEGGFGRVFKGTLQSTGQVVAVRQLDRSGTLGSKEFLAEVSVLSQLEHPNLVKIIGYCADGDQRLLVYEYMPSGSLNNHLFDIPSGKKPLDWLSRMKIAAHIAGGLEFLHEKANPPIIYRDLKSSNILLDESDNPRLSEYGLAKLMHSGNNSHISPRVMAGYGYCAPEYERHGELTLKSDVYSFGVVLLELITGRKALDTMRPMDEQNLVSWAQPFFSDPSRFPDLADPLLKNQFPVTSLNQAVGVAAMCLQEESMVRPLICDIVAALEFLTFAPPEAPIPERLVSILSARVSVSSQGIGCSGTFSYRKKECMSDSEDDGKRKHPKKHKHGSSESESDDSSDDELKDSDRTSSSESKRKTKIESERINRLSSGRSHSTESRDSSIGIGYSSRGGNSIAHQNNVNLRQESQDFYGSSSDDESPRGRQRPHDRIASINSRRNGEEIRSNGGSGFAYSRNSSSSSISDSDHPDEH